MEKAIDHEKHKKLQKAAFLEKVPLIQLNWLIKERREYAIAGNIEAVEALNKIISELLAL